jgi:ectoine hydroxylase-related dioxygenase (phytanoyl-CoA dioxygenase family)
MVDVNHFAEIEELGFTIIPGIVSKDELAELRSQIDAALVADWEEYKDLPGKHRFIALDLVNRGPAFVRLLENERMHEVFSYFLGGTCILYSFTSTVVYPNEEQYTCAIHTDTPRLLPNYHLGLLMTLALDDFTEENGARFYLPGSHRSLEKPSEKEFFAKAVRVSRKAGDAAFFHPLAWHAGGQNRTETPRRGCTIYACRSWMRQRFDYPRMVNGDVLPLLGERGRAFLGFNVRVPANMREFYAPPEQRLYKAGQG